MFTVAMIIFTGVIFYIVGDITGVVRERRRARRRPSEHETYTVLGYGYTNIYDDYARVNPRHMYTSTTITTLSSSGKVEKHEYPKLKLTDKQVETVATTNNWFCDIENLHRNTL